MSSLEQIQQLVQEKFGVDPAALQPNMSMRESGLDSLALVEILFAVEDHFKIDIPDPGQGGIDSLEKLAEVVDQLLAKKAAEPEKAT